jgi:hypothetical protein
LVGCLLPRLDRQLRHAKIPFATRDRHLDTTGDGPLHLRDPRAAKVVVESIVWGVPERYDLFAYAVMHNHGEITHSMVIAAFAFMGLVKPEPKEEAQDVVEDDVESG